MALALDVSSKALASSGVRSFVRELEDTWPVHARETQWQRDVPVPGACIHDLRIMPEFAPCYALTDDQLVFGWNFQSVELALASSPTPASGSGNSGLIAHLDLFQEADARLQSSARAQHAAIAPASGADSLPAVSAGPPPAAGYPFSKLELDAVPVRDSVEIRIRLRSANTP